MNKKQIQKLMNQNDKNVDGVCIDDEYRTLYLKETLLFMITGMNVLRIVTSYKRKLHEKILL